MDIQKKLRDAIKRYLKTIYFILAALCFFALLFQYSLKFIPSESFSKSFELLMIVLVTSFVNLAIYSPDKALEDSLHTAMEEYLKPILNENIANSIANHLSNRANMHCVDYVSQTLNESFEYRIKYVKSSVYDNSVRILEEIRPTQVKIAMKAREFNFNEDPDNGNESLRWFDYLNNYVEGGGKTYKRIVSINPEAGKGELKKDIEWVEQMVEKLQKKK